MGKTQSYILSIQEPCQELWNEMQPQSCGRFCNSCQKEVIDLVDLADAHLLEIIGKNPAGFCGRINIDKMDKPLLLAKERKGNNVSYFRSLAASLFTTVSLLSFLKSTAQTVKKEAIIAQTSLITTEKREQPGGKENKYKVFGNIIDTSNNGQVGVAGKMVRVNADKELVAVTDRWGYYEIEIPQHYKGKIFTISVDCSEEYFGEPVAVRFGALPFQYNFYRKNAKMMYITMGAVAITKVKKTPWWRKIFRK